MLGPCEETALEEDGYYTVSKSFMSREEGFENPNPKNGEKREFNMES